MVDEITPQRDLLGAALMSRLLESPSLFSLFVHLDFLDSN